MIDIKEFTERYVAMWNEGDPAARHDLIIELWAEDATNFTQSFEVSGHKEIEARVMRSYDTYVAPGTYMFKAARSAATHHDVVRIDWEMTDLCSGTSAASGTEFLTLADGRIATDYQFLNP
jgi:hypothetical protein